MDNKKALEMIQGFLNMKGTIEPETILLLIKNTMDEVK